MGLAVLALSVMRARWRAAGFWSGVAAQRA
ncbi:hypothetical protein P775_10435 [Puniceibacterium antarcticum]|uniref:Uncharacterized protein n=1 Tax=Puniceibacterium antarcticum TaxID=1206336 RepID=A0A2G8RGZ3_9RHOB|nr:hypothetical protein P775_10435 [Puniceibacterium antarcticum]